LPSQRDRNSRRQHFPRQHHLYREEQRAALESLVHSAFEDTNLGLGKVKIRKIDFDKANANVVISNCFEAMENGSFEEPNCMFTSGFLAGMFAEVLDKTVQAKETRCI